MAAGGATALDIGRAVGTTGMSVSRYLEKHHIELLPRSACARHDEAVRRMAAAGATLQEIGEAVGSDKGSVRKYLTKHAIERPAWREPVPGAHPMSRRTDGLLNPSWKGGRNTDKSGYILLHMPDHPEATVAGYVREHRIVMERTLGRPLQPGEVVDHINGNKGDNRPENLRVFASNADHLRATLTGVPCPSRGRPGVPKPRSTRRELRTGADR